MTNKPTLQPTHHPLHQQKQPSISLNEYQQRRQALMATVLPNSLILLPAASLAIRNRDAEYPFRQCSDFLYLTGFNEPDALAVFIPQREAGEFVLFCRERDEKAEQWTGRRAGLEGAVQHYAADQAYPISTLGEHLPTLMDGCQAVYYHLGQDSTFDAQVMTWVNDLHGKVRQGKQAPNQFMALAPILHELRLIKSPAEVAMMQYAADTAVQAHRLAMQQCEAGLMEYQLDALFDFSFKQAGMTAAYTSIVGGGENACILHYIDNNQVLKDGDLVLIDAGAEHQAYASDITRTFPVNGRFSPEQKIIYELVLAAQQAAITAAQPQQSWDAPHQAALTVLIEGLLQIGLLTGDLDSIIENKSYRKFYMHNTGHWLGMDVHDVGQYKIDKAWRKLQAGMVLTIEPGLYISPSDDIDPKWWNIGVRIEDDVLITETGNEVLTAALEKSVDAIEALMRK
ncbi:MAG: Xaa-Pro aminopeptidase [bacterium]